MEARACKGPVLSISKAGHRFQFPCLPGPLSFPESPTTHLSLDSISFLSLTVCLGPLPQSRLVFLFPTALVDSDPYFSTASLPFLPFLLNPLTVFLSRFPWGLFELQSLEGNMITADKDKAGLRGWSTHSVRMQNRESGMRLTIHKSTFTYMGPFNLKKIQSDKVKYYCLYFQEKKETKALRG